MPSTQAVLDLLHAWSAAELEGDHIALDALLGDDFIGVGPKGFRRTKDDWIARYRSGAVRNTEFSISDPQLRQYGEGTVVAVAAQTQKSSNNGADASGDFTFTLIVASQVDGLRLVGLHLSPRASVI